MTKALVTFPEYSWATNCLV